MSNFGINERAALELFPSLLGELENASCNNECENCNLPELLLPIIPKMVDEIEQELGEDRHIDMAVTPKVHHMLIATLQLMAACGKEYEETTRSETRNPHYDPFRLRRKLLHHLAGMDPATPKFIAGMPMSLTTYGYLPLWGTFLRELGGKVILTKTTSENTLKQGLHFSQAEFCAPVIAGHGHIAELMESGADFIFLPHMIRATSRTSCLKRDFNGSITLNPYPS